MATQFVQSGELLSATILNWPHRRLSDDISHGQTLFAFIQHCQNGIILIDANGAVVLSNRAAQQIIGFNDGLYLKNGHIAALRNSDNQTLQALINHATESNQPRAMLLPRRSGKRDYIIQFAPLHPDSPHIAERQPVLAMLICNPESNLDVSSPVLEQLFGLTAAEARVAQSLSHGMSLDETATQLGVSRNAIKYHLTTIYKKTQTNRQVQLVRLLAQISCSTASMADPIQPDGAVIMKMNTP